MSRNVKCGKLNNRIFSIFMSVFMLSFVLSPSIYIFSRNLEADKDGSKSRTEENDERYRYARYPSNLFNLPEKDNFKEQVKNVLTLRAAFQSVNRNNFSSILSVTMLGMIAGLFILNVRKTEKNKKVIYLSVGGHAPPVSLNFADSIIKVSTR